jgi:hypothetical protein
LAGCSFSTFNYFILFSCCALPAASLSLLIRHCPFLFIFFMECGNMSRGAKFI